MIKHKDVLKEKLKDNIFKEEYEREILLTEFSLKIHNARKNLGLSQKDVAKKAHITQQQLSKIENGENCNLITFIKVCEALGLKFKFEQSNKKQFV